VQARESSRLSCQRRLPIYALNAAAHAYARSAAAPSQHQPLLYVSRLPAPTTDNELAELLRECLPVRLGLKRDEIGPDGLVEGHLPSLLPTSRFLGVSSS
jgi:hypothetical protein